MATKGLTKSHKGRQSARNKRTGKFTQQRIRTEANKKKRAAKQKDIRDTKIANQKAREEI